MRDHEGDHDRRYGDDDRHHDDGAAVDRGRLLPVGRPGGRTRLYGGTRWGPIVVCHE